MSALRGGGSNGAIILEAIVEGTEFGGVLVWWWEDLCIVVVGKGGLDELAEELGMDGIPTKLGNLYNCGVASCALCVERLLGRVAPLLGLLGEGGTLCSR